jgi:hypothetical protein
VLTQLYKQLDICSLGVLSPENARGLSKSTGLIRARSEVLRYYANFCDFYSQYIQYGHLDEAIVLNQRLIYSPHKVWTQLSQLAHNKLFILSAGLSLGLGYTNATGDESIFFTEIHRQNDAAALERTSAFSGLYPQPQAIDSERSWLVIDKAYTGGSIDFGKRQLRKYLGDRVSITSVALFPKSFRAFASADYAVYAGRLIKVRDVVSELDPVNWHRQLLYCFSP